MRRKLLIGGIILNTLCYLFMVLMGVFWATVPSVDGGLHPAFAMMVYSVIFMLIGVCCYIGEAAIGMFTDFSFLHVIRLLIIAVAGYALFNDLLPGNVICLIASVVLFIMECTALSDCD